MFIYAVTCIEGNESFCPNIFAAICFLFSDMRPCLCPESNTAEIRGRTIFVFLFSVLRNKSDRFLRTLLTTQLFFFIEHPALRGKAYESKSVEHLLHSDSEAVDFFYQQFMGDNGTLLADGHNYSAVNAELLSKSKDKHKP